MAEIKWIKKYEKKVRVIPSPPKPQTNADRIRAMTDEELAEWLRNWTIMVMEDTKTDFVLDGSFVKDAMAWLKKEVKDG